MSIQVGWGTQWETLADAIMRYYGGGIDSVQYQQVAQMLNSGQYTMEEMESILANIPEFDRTYNLDGQLTSVSYRATSVGNTTAGAIANEVNSNVANGVNTQFSTVQNITKDAQTGKVTISDNVKQYHTGSAPTTVKTVASSAVGAICATSAGITAGKSLASAFYNLHPDFWDDRSMQTLNPQTWAMITNGDDSLNSKLFNFVFKIDGDSRNPQAYMNENTLAYMVAYMSANGFFKTSEWYTSGETGQVQGVTPYYPPFEYVEYPYSSGQLIPTNFPNRTGGVTGDGPFYCIRGDVNELGYYTVYFASPNSFKYGVTSATESDATLYTHDGIDSYYGSIQFKMDINSALLFVPMPNITAPIPLGTWDIIATGQITSQPLYEGLTDQDGATVFDDSSITDPTDILAVLTALQTQYPELWENRIEMSPDGENTLVYVPVGFPTGGTGIQPTTEGATQSDLAPDITGNGDNATDELVKTLIDMLQNPKGNTGMESNTTTPTEPIDPNVNDVGSGKTPPFIIPSGSASALYTIYNPSQAQLNSLGAWLWSPNFVDQLLKLFNDPMQAIIGLHKVFSTPPISGTSTIKVGYLDSGVSSKLVSAQYTEVDCGTVKLDEYFKNALDYVKTDVYLYLPFIGIVPLNVEDVTRANINVKYKVDVLTGACLASVNVTRDANGGGQLYAYSGNCAVQYPLSSGSYMGIVAGILGIAGSAAGTMLSGGAMLPLALGAGASAMNSMKTKVEHSGSLSGNAGAMGIKKPYLIIRRPQTKIATNYELLAGGSNNVYGVLNTFSGHVRVKYVHLENIPATNDELTQIEELLKSGVII